MTPTEAKDRVVDNIRDSVAAIGEVAFAARAELIAARTAQLQRATAELEQLTLAAKAAQGDAKEATQKTVEKLRLRWAAAKRELDAMEDASEASWKETLAQVAAEYDALEASLTEARRWAADKIAP